MGKDLYLIFEKKIVEEYKDGLCIDCWIKKNKKLLKKLNF